MILLLSLNKKFGIVLLFLNLLVYIPNAVNSDENEDELDWWQTAVFYQIFLRSFKDSNGDGVEDLKGIEEEAAYFNNIGVDCICLSPIYQSPMASFGYDISDYQKIDSVFGTLDDFRSLKQELKTRNIKIIMDFVPNHTSVEHEWFKNSVEKIEPYTNYYVWKDAKIDENGLKVPPNNWKSVFNTPAWTWNEARGQYYLHQFHTKQPDLNYRNQKVIDEMKINLRFWLDQGVDGYKMHAIGFLFEDDQFMDEEKNSEYLCLPDDSYAIDIYDRYHHSHTADLDETYGMVSQFRELLDEYKVKDGVTRVLITEAYTSLENVFKYYGSINRPRAHLSFNFLLMTNLNALPKASDFNTAVHKWLVNMPRNAWANWAIGNHDNPRVATWFESEMVDAMNMLNLLLPGTAFTYMGEEIGMEDAKIIYEEDGIQYPGRIYYQILSENLGKTPNQWDASKSSGFSFYSNTWLPPVDPNHWKINLDSYGSSRWFHYDVYKRLVDLRKTKTIRRGAFKGRVLTYDDGREIYVFSRSLPDEKTYLVVINISSDNVFVTLADLVKDKEKNWTVHICSINSEYSTGYILPSGGFDMLPNSALVLS